MHIRFPATARSRFWIVTALAVVVVAAASCGDDDDDNPTAPSGSGDSTATLTIAVGGAISPSTATILRGDRVTFVNNDTVSHTMASDPHGPHTDCPALNVGTLGPAQSRVSGQLNTPRSCGFHDHDNPDSPGLKGTIVVQ